MLREMQQLLAGTQELNERARAAEARADAERQAQATQQELARSQQAGAKGREEVVTALQPEQGIGAFASKYQPQSFEGEDDKWRAWARVFRSWSGRLVGGALAEVYEHVEGHRSESATINDLAIIAPRCETELVRNSDTELSHVLNMLTKGTCTTVGTHSVCVGGAGRVSAFPPKVCTNPDSHDGFKACEFTGDNVHR